MPTAPGLRPLGAPSPALRTDIQALRGLAVAFVVLYHAGLGPFAAGLPGGFLGVDIFFVLSGYLITRLIVRAQDTGQFAFGQFYLRRARRLAPAALVVFAACAAAAPFMLAEPERSDFAWQLLGALGFASNFVLHGQTMDYFAGAAAVKPLLHTWSLAIEEQYYLVLPVVLVLCPARLRIPLVALAAFASLLACLSTVRYAQADAFFLPQYRAWELVLGSLGALLEHRGKLQGRTAQQLLAHLFWPALVLVVALPLFPRHLAHPGLSALWVCLATLVVVLRAHGQAWSNAPARALAHLGTFSYSLYLVHWPLLAFATNAHVSDTVPLAVRVGCVLASLALAWALWRFVEEPLRHPRAGAPAFRFLAGWLVVCAGLAAGALFLLHSPGTDPQSIAQRLTPNRGLALGRECRVPAPGEPADCRTADAPEFALWGDSHAMHLVPALQADSRARFVQFTHSSCAPLTGVTRKAEHSCANFNDATLHWLLHERPASLHTVVLAARLRPYLVKPRAQDKWQLHVRTAAGTLVPRDPDHDFILGALAQTVDALRAAGLRVVLVSSPPITGQALGRCLARATAGLFVADFDAQCSFARADFEAHEAHTLALYEAARNTLALPVISLADALCTKERCRAQLDGHMVYRDETHLAIEGSRALGLKMRLFEQIRQAAAPWGGSSGQASEATDG